jgi:hypothetical protein
MPNFKISQLTTATAVSATNQFEINQNAASRSLEVSVLSTYIRSGDSGKAIVVSVSTASDALRITQTGTGNALVVEDSANPDSTPFVVDANGDVLLGHTTALASPINASFKDKLQLNSVNAYGSSIDLTSWSTGTDTGASIHLLRSDSGVIGTQTAIGSADVMGNIRFWGSDGTTFIEGAKITAAADGTTGTNDMPTSLRFSTTADGASSPTERMRISNSGATSITAVGTGGVNGTALTVTGTNLSGATTNVGISIAPTFGLGATVRGIGVQSTMNTEAGGAGLATAAQFRAIQGTLSTAVTNQYGYWADSTLIGATNNYGFYSNIASGTGRWNFYAAGTADNYFGGPTTISTSSTSDALRITQTGTGNALVVEDNTNPDSSPFVVDADGSAILGFTTRFTTATTGSAKLQLITGSATISRFLNDANPQRLEFAKSRSTTSGSAAVIVQSGDTLGDINFQGADGTSFVQAASIAAAVDGTPGTNDMPGRLVFSTTADGASTPTERMRIDSSGNVGIGTSSPATKLDVVSAGTTPTIIQTRNGTTSVYLDANNGYSYLNTFTNHPMLFGTNNAERMRIDSSGNVGIGTSSPNSLLELNKASGAADLRFSVAGTLYGTAYASSSDMTINSITAIPLKLGTNNTERFQIGSSGQLGIGGANYGTSGQVLTSNGSGSAPSWQAAGGSTGALKNVQVFTSSGTYTRTSGVTTAVVVARGGGGGGGGEVTAGGAGGTTSFGSHVSAAGGSAGGRNSGGGAGGTGGTGATIALKGQGGGSGGYALGICSTSIGVSGLGGGQGGGQSVGYGGVGVAGVRGGGGSGGGTTVLSGGGGQGETAIKYTTTVGSTETVTIGAGGTAGIGPPAGGAGGAGFIIVYEYS